MKELELDTKGALNGQGRRRSLDWTGKEPIDWTQKEPRVDMEAA